MAKQTSVQFETDRLKRSFEELPSDLREGLSRAEVERRGYKVTYHYSVSYCPVTLAATIENRADLAAEALAKSLGMVTP